MEKIVLSFSIILLSIILTGCVDKEIKELNGEWESYDGNKLKLIIKNDSMNIIEYDDYSTKEEAEKRPHKAKIVKEDGKLYGIDSEGDKAVYTMLVIRLFQMVFFSKELNSLVN
ncbi:TPA: hypothetical protein R1902_000890 [Staphylococcus delphini]|nr:hypothetical protein [Staphylococcus delphini]HEC2151302.1 hypothetical protein [Staphylococcus delphini]HEC2159879.1 hypothetical protein [Staphylococcus delphini]HEC2169449.1 hypothetical protein [Staphylococcus delphini]HEC2177978.1 hypothetical protein [Staphylococcus delphini]